MKSFVLTLFGLMAFVALPVFSMPAPAEEAECVCEEVFCILSFPEGCICQNNAKIACYEKCGGAYPVLQDCGVTAPPPASTTTTTSTTKKPKPTPIRRPCGVRPLPPCPAGQVCVDDPKVGGCGMACDRPGICVAPIMCGGFTGRPCPDGKQCVDDPRDSCDPRNGGADCSGICV